MGRKANPNKAPTSLSFRPIRPKDLIGTARKFWDLIVPLLHEMEYLQKIDRPALELLCDSWSIYQDIQKKISVDTLTSKTDKGNIIQHPLVSARNAAYKQLVGMMNEFGMTPAARVKMTREPVSNNRQMGIPLMDRPAKPKAGEVPPDVQAQLGNGGAVGNA